MDGIEKRIESFEKRIESIEADIRYLKTSMDSLRSDVIKILIERLKPQRHLNSMTFSSP